MFQKPTFGNTSTGFGSFNASVTTSSPFSGFKPTGGTSAFGAPPAFGAAATSQPTTGGGLFGSTNTTGGLFGSTTTANPAPAFGGTGGFGFGASTSNTGLFGNTQTTGGLFGANSNNSAFGAKPSGFGFGNTSTAATTGGIFGPTPSTSTGLFGQQNNTLGGGGLFSNTTGAFGQQAASGTGHVKYSPLVGTDVVVKSGTSQSVSIKHHCITCMKEYEGKSLEELRLEDYVAGRKGSSGTMFGGFQQQTENKPLFGGTTAFGQPTATTNAPSLFGGGGLNTSGFGQTNTFSFGGNTNTTNTTGLFANQKPAFGATATTGTGLFGASTTQAPAFGTNTSTFGFGSNTQNQGSGLFGAKPATSGFGTTGSSGFGSFSGIFGAKTTATPAFGTTTPAFGTASSGFGTATSGSGLFGANNSFGKTNTTQPTFGFNSLPTLGSGLGTGLNNSFQAKPAAPAFGNLGTGSIFQQPAQNTFKTGLDSGLGGGGMFGGNTSLGFGNTGLGLGTFNSNNTGLAGGGVSGASAGGNIHEQILATVARPYGDNPLFKDLPNNSSASEDVLKPTNPAAVKAALESGASAAYRVTSPASRLRVLPRHALAQGKKSLFDGLEEYDASLVDKLSLKPSRKRLVLRPKNREDNTDAVDNHVDSNRSTEEPVRNDVESAAENDEPKSQASKYGSHRDHTDSDSGRINLENSTDRNESWNGSSKMPWNDKEKPIENDSTPRLYPNLDKELPAQVLERRASWLTTKSLRKPLPSNPDLVENSVRELGVNTDRASQDKENIDSLSVSEEENAPVREMPPHPAGVKLTRPGYYTIPSLEEMINYMRPDGSCVVPHLTIGRKNYGNVFYDCEIDVAGMDLDALVHFLNKEVIVYPDDADKPPVGEGLNRRAIITLDRVWPRDKTERRPLTEPDRLLKMDYEGKLRRVCDKHDTKFIEYRPQTGSWVFRVEHFSKYGLTDSDEEDEPTPAVLKRQLVGQTLQQSAAPVSKPPEATPGLGGLSEIATGVSGFNSSLGGPSLASPGLTPGLAGPGFGRGLGLASGLGPADDLFAMHQTSLNLLNGSNKDFELDNEEHSEVPNLYQDNRALSVKSPTSELARLEHRPSHDVQLMKASLYADTEMEDDVSTSTGDQLVPHATALLSVPVPTLVTQPEHSHTPEPVHQTEEAIMRPLVVHPHTIVLKYHKKIPPFKETIAGRLDASLIADMSICRARHSRVGFGPANTLVYATTFDSINDKPKSAELSELCEYTAGRGPEDWSEQAVARLALGLPHASAAQKTLALQLESLLEYSETSEEANEETCPRLVVKSSPADRLALLRKFLDAAQRTPEHSAQFGVSSKYCLQVWRLCETLWGADLENDGVCGTDEHSKVYRHRRLLQWLMECVADATDRDLAQATAGEQEDESDGHSSRVWTLLAGGRILKACQLSQENGDLHMATLIAQATGDPGFRSLLSRQFRVWRDSGADAYIAAARKDCLRLLAGDKPDRLRELDWCRALHLTARYLCPQVPSLEQIIRTYEGYFREGEEEVNLTTLPEDELGMQFPSPPYLEDYQITDSEARPPRRVLDLRYELIRARATHSRANIRPAACSPDPFDYCLCFLLEVWFGNPSASIVAGAAEQLETMGEWHLAVQVLAYHPDHRARSHLIRGVLSRQAPARPDSPELQARLQLVKRLRVPEHWLLLAQAHRAKYEHQPTLEVEYLVEAKQWNAAHRVLLDELLPEVVLADNVGSLQDILEKMNAAAQRHELSGWDCGGRALYHYLRLCREVRGVVAAGGGGARLEALRPDLAAACQALQRLKLSTGRGYAARAEMGARLVQLAIAGGERARLPALLRALRLPPDCAAPAIRHITTDLAEQASELCIDSASSSPISLQRKTAVKS